MTEKDAEIYNEAVNDFRKTTKVFIIILTVVLVLVSYDAFVVSPVASENALVRCNEIGFNDVEDFSKLPFSSEPLALKCKQTNRGKPINCKELKTK